MDAVELTYPVDVSVPKLIGSEGFGRAGVAVKEIEARESDCVSIVVSHSIERCGSYLSGKEVGSSVKASESAFLHKIPGSELSNNPSQLPSFQGRPVSEQLRCRSSNSILPAPRPEGAQSQRKVGRLSKSSSVSSKRQKILQYEDSVSPSVVDNANDISDQLGSYSTKCTSPEKSHFPKQKNFSSKRGDKRNSKVHLKGKYDSFPVKAGLSSFSSAAGGNNFVGIHGLKSDVDEVTKHLDNLSLDELLDGTFKYTKIGKNNVKKAANMNENILQSVRKACSVFQLSRPAQPQNFSEIDSCCNKSPTCFDSVSNDMNNDKGDSNKIDESSHNKDECHNLKIPGELLDFPSYQPKDMLERLALPPPKNLEALLLDATKPVVSLRNTPDSRSGRQIPLGASLPPFPWSHASSGIRTNVDVVKSSTSRTSCQGRWVRIGNSSAELGVVTNSFTDLESLTYDQSLVPPGKLRLGISENKICPSTSANLPLCVVGSSSSATCSYASHVAPEPEGKINYRGNAGHSPRVLAAAQTLCDIATLPLRKIPDGIVRWPKKASQKAMKARKSRSNEKAEETSATPTSVSMSDNLIKSADQIFLSKKPKLSVIENKKDLGQFTSIRKVPLSWSTPKSNRSSPMKSIRDSFPERRQTTTNIMKQSSMMPPPAKISDIAQQKPRKLVLDWNRGRERLGL